MTPPTSNVQWHPSYRIVSSRFPPIGPFDRVSDPVDLEVVYDIDGLTNARLRVELGELHLVAPEDRVSGPGTTPIMAAFTHVNRAGSRFSDGSYGVYYAALHEATAVKETVYHHSRFLRENRARAQDLDMRVYVADIDGPFHDIRGWNKDNHVYAPGSYIASQALGHELRDSGSYGVVYHSVRHSQGQCIAVFRPPPISQCRQSAHYTYRWDGTQITDVYEKRSVSFTP